MFKKNILKIIAIFSGLIYLSSLYISALAKGGRWDLNEQIAFAQRMLSGNLLYANGETDLFFPSSPYFPGVGFLSYFYAQIGVDDVYLNNIIMLLTAVSIGVLYFILMAKLTVKIYPKLSSIEVYATLLVILMTNFSAYTSYMIEFKPDSILLLIGVASFFLLENHKQPRNINLILVGFLLFISVFFKQSFFLIFLLCFILIFLNSHISLVKKMIISLTYALIALAALSIIFSIENIYYFTVEAMSMHYTLDAQSIVKFFGGAFIFNITFCIALLYFLHLKFRDFSFQTIESKYFIFSVAWFLFSCLATTKSGGNTGNIEAGLIVFAPYVIYAIVNFLNKYAKKYLNMTYGFLLSALILVYSGELIVSTKIYVQKVNQDISSIKFLSDKFKNKKAFVDGDTYIVSKASGLEILTEAETVSHFNNIIGYDMSKLKDAIAEKKYDLIFLQNDLTYLRDKDILNKIEKNYILFQDENLPSSLEGLLLIPGEKK